MNHIWRNYRCIENSLVDYLQENFDNDWGGVVVKLDWKPDTSISLPQICLYWDSSDIKNLELGSHILDEKNLMIIEIYATGAGQRGDLASYIVNLIKKGFAYYQYAPNPVDLANPLKTETDSHVSVSFVSNNMVEPIPGADKYERNRHRIAITAVIL